MFIDEVSQQTQSMINNAQICRVCGATFHENSLLHLKGMPQTAQYFPEKHQCIESIGTDLNV